MSYSVIAREGWPILGYSFLLSLCITFFFGWSWSLIFWLFTIFSLQFFRDPKRTHIPKNLNNILSAADGRVVAVGLCYDHFACREALKISVFMNVFNVHSNWICANAKVTKLVYVPGKFFNAILDKACLENEHNAMVLELATKEFVTVVQIAGLLARRILCYVKVGDKVSAGERYGFIRFGSRVDLYLPANATAMVAIGDKVSAVKTVVAKLKTF